MSNPLQASASLILSNTCSKAGLLVRNKYRLRRNFAPRTRSTSPGQVCLFRGDPYTPIYVLAVGSHLHAYVVEWRQMDARVV